MTHRLRAFPTNSHREGAWIMSYVYTKTEPELWTVGFYKPDGSWVPESDHTTPKGAAMRVHYLNGGTEEKS